MNPIDTFCGQCGKKLLGRRDRKYCSDSCRFAVNNRKKQENRMGGLVREVNRILLRNRQLLHQASPFGKTTLDRALLEQAGFNFRYHTHQHQTQRGSVYNFCYDYGYLLLPENKMLIVQHQSYMTPLP